MFKIKIFIFCLFIATSIVVVNAVDWTPYGDINLRDFYDIKAGVNASFNCINLSGTWMCTWPSGGGVGKEADSFYLYNSTSVMFFNATKLNATITDLATGLSGGNVSWNQSFADTLYSTGAHTVIWDDSFNASFDDRDSVGTGNVSWNETTANNLYLINSSDINIADNTFKGVFNWTVTFVNNFLFGGFDGSELTIQLNQTKLNNTIGQYTSNLSASVNITLSNVAFINESNNFTENQIISANLTTSEYYFGQPITGSLDSGIIQADEIDNNGNLNITHNTGLNISYPNFKVRLVSSITGVEVYCDIKTDSILVPDNTHTAYYIDTNCALQNIPVKTFVDASLNNAGNVPVFHAMSHSGEIEVHQGLPIQNRIFLRSRVLSFKTINLDVVSGLGIIEEGGLNFTINSGEFVFIDQEVDTTNQNLSNGSILEIFYRDGGTYLYDEYSGDTQTGFNLTSCEDASQDIVECSSPTKYRRYFIFLTGYLNGDDDTEIHQRLARDDVYYNNIGDCLNIVDNPLTYDLPDIYTFTAVPLYAYCGQAGDTSFDGSFIDLRTVKSGSAGSDIDTSIFLTRDGSRTLTNDWNAGVYNISLDGSGDGGWFQGLFNFTAGGFFSWTGALLNIDTTKLNATITEIVQNDFQSSFDLNISAVDHTVYGDFNTTDFQSAFNLNLTQVAVEDLINDTYVNVKGDDWEGNMSMEIDVQIQDASSNSYISFYGGGFDMVLQE